jgi:hypothetical protein
LNLEIGEKHIRGTNVSEMPLVENGDGIVKMEMAQAMGDAENDPGVFTGEIAKELHDLILGFDIEAARDLIAKKKGGITRQFKGEGEATFLSTRKNLGRTIGEFKETDGFKKGVDTVINLLGLHLFAELKGAFDIFPYGQTIESDAKLGDVADLTRIKILFLFEIP